MIQSLARQWVEAVLHQGRQVLEFHEGAGTSHPPDVRRWQHTQEHLFVIVLGKALEWLDELVSLDSQLGLAIDTFYHCVPNAREVRNMREHDHNYLCGKGRQQTVFHRRINGRVSNDATAKVILNGRYL